MPIENLERYGGPVLAIPATAAATAEPTDASTTFIAGAAGRITTYIHYTGTVTSGVLRLLTHDGVRWYRGASHPLASSEGSISLDWTVGGARRFGFRIESIAGGGTVEVGVEGV